MMGHHGPQGLLLTTARGDACIPEASGTSTAGFSFWWLGETRSRSKKTELWNGLLGRKKNDMIRQ